MAKSAIVPSTAARLTTARDDLTAAIAKEQTIAAEENLSLATDEQYMSWARRKRVAENERRRLIELIAQLEAQQQAEVQAAELAAFDRRYKAAIDASDRVIEMYRKDLPQAWEIIANVLRAAAEAEIEVMAVRDAMPASYEPKQPLFSPDATVRCRRAQPERILSEEIQDLIVDRDTNGLFADQSAPPKNRNWLKRRFKVTTYTLMRRGEDVAPFAKTLVFPRLTDNGPNLFDGAEVATPQDVLRQLRDRPEPAAVDATPLTKIEAL